MRSKVCRSTLTLAMFLAAACQVWGQQSGSLSGNVVESGDPKQPVSNATVVLYRSDEDEPFSPAQTTGPTGDFSFNDIPQGTYRLRLSCDGFQKIPDIPLTISPADTRSMNNLGLPRLGAPPPPPEPTESVQKADDQIDTTLNNDQLRWLPQLLRDPLQLIDTQGGVSSNGSTFTTIDGLRPSYNNVTLDGINIQDNYYRLKSLDYIPNRLFLDQVSEFTLVTSNSNSTYGNGAAQVAFATPSGQNSFHGGAYFMDSPNALNANEWFNNANGLVATSRRFQGGAKLGGPILKDKLFFYVNYEFLGIRDNTPTQVIAFGSSLLAGQTINPAIQKALGPLLNPSSSTPIPGGGGFVTTQVGEPDDENRDNLTFRLDYQPTRKQFLSATYAWNHEFVNNIDADNINYLPTAPLLTDDNRNFLSLAWQVQLEHFTNDLRGGFNLAPITFGRQGGLPPYLLDLSQLQADYGLASPIGVPLLAGTENKLYQSTASIDPLSNDWGDSRRTNTYNLQDNAVWSNKGPHTLKFGFQTQLIRDALSDSNGITPLYQFGATNAFNQADELAGVLAGQISLITQSYNVTNTGSKSYSEAPSARHYRYDNYSFYLQDNWKVSERLTVTAGLRYELYPPVRATDGLALTPRLMGNDAVNTVLSPSAVFQYASGNLYKPQHLNFAPAVGVAFDPSGLGRTVLRAGYSIAFVNDDLIGAIDSALTSNLGLLVTQTGFPAPGATPIQAPSLSPPQFPSSFTLANPLEQGQIGMVDPSLRVPYVQQWNAGIQHLLHGFLLDARYVGNHATGMIREVSFNQVDLCGSGFLNDFIAAGGGNPVPSCTTSSRKNFFEGFYDKSQQFYGLSEDVQTGQAATAAAEYNALGKSGYALYRNVNALAGAGILGNYSSSFYNGLQLSVRRRLANGLQLQASYTFSKDLSDSARTGDSAFEPYRDFAGPRLDWARTPFDLSHAFKGNFIYKLPLGEGLNGEALRVLLGGWSVSGIVTVQSGDPFSILSGLATVDTVTAALNTADSKVGGSALNQLLGVRQVDGAPYFMNPAAVADFGNPTAGRLGYLQQREFSGPWVWDVDLGLQKTVRIKEGQTIEIRGEALNLLNRASWLIGDQNINALAPPPTTPAQYLPVRTNTPNLNFGQILNTFYPSRKIQVSLYYRF